MSRIKIDNIDFITVPEVAKLLKRPRMTLYRWIKRGKVASVKMGGIMFILASEVDRLKKEVS